ncbi:bifunctional glycoside hydrolase 114/ polysaccharide deacetylase family protein [Acidithiobacillus caldus]|uniref:bifunctional glycoside hydrolase 114/ polysaccharide deacetylase family protein n=1 Tax=Acidithiobacillus caldus TaxID=33059 RepID=UPI001D025AFD|nr:endo alpha-1,4 polygalactosaminidase [Acidithiobacillus caldus]
MLLQRTRWLRFLTFMVLAVWAGLSWAAPEDSLPSVGLYYGSGPAPAAFRDFHWLVVNPGAERLPSAFPGQQVFAYVSVGETVPGDARYAQLPQDCVLGTNRSWGGKIIDLAKSSCRGYVLHQVVDPIWAQGYRGFFLDTLDSYESVTKGAARHAQEEGLVDLIKALKTAHPEAKLIANRGFSVLPEIHGDLVAVLAESLYRGWDQAEHRYTEVPESERRALLRELHKAQGFGLPVVIVDYMPPAMNRSGWWEDAQRIRADGFIPYVSNPELTAVGAGLREPMPRKVLVLYNSTQPEEYSTPFANGAMPLEYLGYIPEFRRLSQGVPPPVPGEYAGVIFWSDGDPVDDVPALSHWIREARAQGIPILLLGDFQNDLDAKTFAALGMIAPRSVDATSVELIHAAAEMQYEMSITPDARDFLAAQAPSESRVWLQLQAAHGDREDAAAITPWGGYVLSPYLLTTLPNKDTRWLVDPFALYRQAFRLPKMPVPDTTTESGRRLFMAHTDGDGFVSRADFPPYHIAGQVYMDRILKKYRLPFTGSVIVGDLLPGDRGLYPALAPLGTQVARELFRLPYVEIGSHMWSHPFNWPAIEAGKDYPGINLPVPGYTFSPYMEAVGAAKWIDKHLAPPGKQVVIDQWSGDCEPDAQVVGLAYGAGLENINGGTSYISKKNPSITAVPPIGIFRGKWLQVFAPDANEDYFTNQWHGPYWGYIDVIQTFEMTDKPHRLKPIDIYTHWYTATKLASLSALERVYDWVLKQSITPVYVADYAKIANNFFTIHIARQGDGFWIGGAKVLQELRMPKDLGYPNLLQSQGIAGYHATPNGRWYVHMDGRDSTYLALQSTPPQPPYIASANAAIADYRQDARGFSAELDGTVPVTLRLGNAQACRARINGKPAAIGDSGEIRSDAEHVRIDVHCS